VADQASLEHEAASPVTTREAEIKSKIHFIKAALQNLKSNFPQFKSVRAIGSNKARLT
jgi:hypothetical protein